MDGWTVARTLHGDPAHDAIPVIALTAHAMAGDRAKAATLYAQVLAIANAADGNRPELAHARTFAQRR